MTYRALAHRACLEMDLVGTLSVCGVPCLAPLSSEL